MARGDSFVVETNVHFPADISQLYDAMRKVLEVCATLSALQGSTQWRQFSHNLRGIKRLLRVVHKLKKSTSKNPEKKAHKDQKIKQAHREYLAAANHQLQRAISTGAEFGGVNPLLLSKLNHYVAHAEVQMDQIRRRVLNEEIIPHSEKVFSIFQPHTEWISKGKAGVPVELGLKVCIIEDQYRFILHHQVMEQVTDSEIAVSIVEETKKRFPNLQAISYDKGFHSPKNQIELKTLVEKVVLPKKGKLSKLDKAHESEPEFRKLRRQHSAVESAINALEVHGLDICLDHGYKVCKFRWTCGLVTLDKEFPVFALVFCIISKHDYLNYLVPTVQKLKLDIWGHDQVILHERDIRKESGIFATLRTNKALREEFLERLTQIIADAPIQLITSIIDKPKLLIKYTDTHQPL